ncbi:hypothetical protein EV193_102620 [Herbihabitans rhizosphaerae]|uniref:Uncharacterized protein n=1 Tax=Herbihabitans rhizosphaerae TaxID=1872711 RepID=A0A4Q7L279_9PSEU|nr:hypothetical protein [Herbihabitans rhizosphaerae]RZS43639.1 hypothetical protein EV193_102620 [Herbihabitans rhizosphaerae]
MSPPTPTPEPGQLADEIADAVLAHPAVARLDGGPFGVVATLVPGRKVIGVTVDESAGAVEIAVVLLAGNPIPAVVAELRERVRAISGAGAVDVTVTDIVDGDA